MPSDSHHDNHYNNHEITWEDILAVIGVLGLAGIFIWYQILAPNISPAYAHSSTSDVSQTATKTDVDIHAEASRVQGMNPAIKSPQPATQQLEQVAVLATEETQPDNTVPAQNTGMPPAALLAEEQQQNPVAEIAAAYTGNHLTAETQEPPRTAGEIFHLERNIETNLVDFSGKTAANGRVKLLIDGEATPIIQADESGLWVFSQNMKSGFYTFEVMWLDNAGKPQKTSAPATYQILPRNTSSAELPSHQ